MKYDTRRSTCPALLLYDYLLTFPAEIHFVWKRELSGVTVIFLVMRYAAMLNALMGVLELTLCPHMYVSCSRSGPLLCRITIALYVEY